MRNWSLPLTGMILPATREQPQDRRWDNEMVGEIIWDRWRQDDRWRERERGNRMSITLSSEQPWSEPASAAYVLFQGVVHLDMLAARSHDCNDDLCESLAAAALSLPCLLVVLLSTLLYLNCSANETCWNPDWDQFLSTRIYRSLSGRWKAFTVIWCTSKKCNICINRRLRQQQTSLQLKRNSKLHTGATKVLKASVQKLDE